MPECALCLETKPYLCDSHIIPRNFFRDLKKTSYKRRLLHFTNTDDKHMRKVQDGLKVELLCSDCEQLIGGYEKTFKEKFFLPFMNGQKILKYHEWLLKYAVSLSWRVCIYHRQSDQLGDKDFPGMREKLNKGMEVWRKFLLGKRENPDKYEQHIFPLIVPKWYQRKYHRQISDSIGTQLFVDEDKYLVYSKVQSVAIVGVIELPHITAWRDSRISVSRGRFIAFGDYKLPEIVSAFFLHSLNIHKDLDA